LITHPRVAARRLVDGRQRATPVDEHPRGDPDELEPEKSSEENGGGHGDLLGARWARTPMRRTRDDFAIKRASARLGLDRRRSSRQVAVHVYPLRQGRGQAASVRSSTGEFP